MTNYRKSIAAAVGAVITILSATGLIDVVAPEVQASIVTLLTVAAVYLLPNQKALSGDFTAFYFDANQKKKQPVLRDYANEVKGNEGSE